MSTAFADPAKYELYDCKQLETERKSLASRGADLQGLMAKAETGVAGSVVAEVAYRNEIHLDPRTDPNSWKTPGSAASAIMPAGDPGRYRRASPGTAQPPAKSRSLRARAGRLLAISLHSPKPTVVIPRRSHDDHSPPRLTAQRET